MEIKVEKKVGTGEICFSWRERWIILTKGKITMQKEVTKTFINVLFNALINLNHVLPDDIKNKATDISKDKISVK